MPAGHRAALLATGLRAPREYRLARRSRAGRGGGGDTRAARRDPRCRPRTAFAHCCKNLTHMLLLCINHNGHEAAVTMFIERFSLRICFREVVT